MRRKSRTQQATAKPCAYLNVNSHRIKRNPVRTVLGEEPEAVIAVRGSKTSPAASYTNHVEILDAQGNVVAEVRYEPEGGLVCGAKVFIACHHAPRVTTAVQES